MPRVIHIDRSFTPKQRSAEADAVRPPAPASDLLKPRLYPGDVDGVAPTMMRPAPAGPGSAGRLKGKARQSRQAARKSKASGPQPTPSPNPRKGPAGKSPMAGEGTAPADKPRVFVQKVKSSLAPVASPVAKPRSNGNKRSLSRKIGRVMIPLGKGLFAASKAIARLVMARKKKTPKQPAGTGKTVVQVSSPKAVPKPQIIIHRSAGPSPPTTAQGRSPGPNRPVAKVRRLAEKPAPAAPQKTASAPQKVRPPAVKSVLPQQRAQLIQKNFGRPIKKRPVSSPPPVAQPVAKMIAPPPPPQAAPVKPVQPPPRPAVAAAPPKPKIAARPPVPNIVVRPPPPRPLPVPREAPKDAQGLPDVEDLRHRRLVSLDAFRGFVMLLLLAAGFGSVELAGRPENIGSFWYFLAPLFQAGGWLEVSAWDLVQPAFVFMVGVALPFSYAHRCEYGHSWNAMLGHAGGRAVTLVLLGVLLTSAAAGRTTWEFNNVLSQIGMGYLVVFLLWRQSPVLQVGYVAVLFLGYAGMFYYYDWIESGLRAADLGLAKTDQLPGLFAPFTRDVNFAAGFDRWFLNLFPRGELFVKHPEGLQTLNFVPSIATMVLGLMAGELLQSADRPEQKFNKLLMAGVACLGLGIAAGITVCPIVKRIWTPSWVLFSGAFVIWMLAAFYGFFEVLGKRRWAFPLVVLGMNSLVAYLLLELGGPKILGALQRYGAADLFRGEFGPVWQPCALLFSVWMVCLYLYCQRAFFRV